MKQNNNYLKLLKLCAQVKFFFSSTNTELIKIKIESKKERK